MNVIDVPRKINLIPDSMFPIPPLPDAALTLGLAARMNVLAFFQPLRETDFDERLTQRRAGIVRQQAPYRIQVSGSPHHRQDGKRMCAFHRFHGCAQIIDMPHQ